MFSSTTTKIIIATSPAEVAAYQNCLGSPSSGNTIVLEQWTPIHRLSDICAWLVEACILRAALGISAALTTTVGTPTATTTTYSTHGINHNSNSSTTWSSPLSHHHQCPSGNMYTVFDCPRDHRSRQQEQQEEKKEDSFVGPPSLPVEDDDCDSYYLDSGDSSGARVVWRAPSPLWDDPQYSHPSCAAPTITTSVAPLGLAYAEDCSMRADNDTSNL